MSADPSVPYEALVGLIAGLRAELAEMRAERERERAEAAAEREQLVALIAELPGESSQEAQGSSKLRGGDVQAAQVTEAGAGAELA